MSNKAVNSGDWTECDTSLDETVIIKCDNRSLQKRLDSVEDAEQKRLDEDYDRVEKELKRESDMSRAFIDITRYTRENGVFILDRCDFQQFRQFLLEKL